MAPSDKTFGNRPFEHLERLLRRKSRPSLPRRSGSNDAPERSNRLPSGGKTDRQLFLDAVTDVIPLRKCNRSVGSKRRRRKKHPPDIEELESYRRLERLVRSGEGFVISQLPEYMEGTGYHVHRSITRYLHQGHFSIQAHIDLHGLDGPNAEAALERFLKQATTDGLRAVLIIHGRGLSSPGEPVLKTRLRELLGSSRWRKWILAFSSARRCDGGTGATYVLLRKKPLSKQFRKVQPLPLSVFERKGA